MISADKKKFAQFQEKIKPLKEIGKRLSMFEKFLNKNHKEMAKELAVDESTISEILIGHREPPLNFLKYWQKTYRLDINWLLTGNGKMFLPKDIKLDIEDIKLLLYKRIDEYLNENREKWEHLADFLRMLRIPVIEEILWGRLLELKVIAKDAIDNFYKEKKR